MVKGTYSHLMWPSPEGMPQKMGGSLTFIDASQIHVSSHYTVNTDAFQIVLIDSYKEPAISSMKEEDNYRHVPFTNLRLDLKLENNSAGK